MPRKVILEEKILSYLADWSDQARFTCGLMIGQCSRFRDFIIHCPRTQLEQGTVRILPQLEGDALNRHATKVLGSLPGGFHVMGVFFMCPEEVFVDEPSFDKVITVVGEVFQVLSNEKELCGTTPRKHLLLLHMNSRTKQAGCAEVSLSNSGPTLKQADHTFASLSCDWIVGKYIWNYQDHGIKTTDGEGKFLPTHHLKIQLDKLVETVPTCTQFINGEVKKDELVSLKSNISLKNKSMIPFHGIEKDINVTVQFTIRIALKEDETQVKYNKAESNSTSPDLIFMHQDATLSEAYQAVKDDVLRSSTAKYKLHLESIAKGDSTERGSLNRRVVVITGEMRVGFSCYLGRNDDPWTSHRLEDLIKGQMSLKRDEPWFILDPDRGRGIPLKIVNGTQTEEESKIPNIMIFAMGSLALLGAIYFSLVFNRNQSWFHYFFNLFT